MYRDSIKPGGIKHDIGKSRIDLIPPKAILEVAKVFTDGVKEYGEYNWKKGIVYSRLYAAIQRHLLAFWSGEDIDKSGHRALAHACTDIMMLMEMSEEWDDRYNDSDIDNGEYYLRDQNFLSRTFVDAKPTGL